MKKKCEQTQESQLIQGLDPEHKHCLFHNQLDGVAQQDPGLRVFLAEDLILLIALRQLDRQRIQKVGQLMDLELNSNSLHNVRKLHQNVNQFLFCFVRYLKPRSNQLLELSDPRFLEDRADPRIGIEQINRSVPFKVSHLLLVELVVLYPRLPQIVVLNRPDSDFLRGVLELLLFEISDLSLPLFLRPLHKSPQRFLLRFVQQHLQRHGVAFLRLHLLSVRAQHQTEPHMLGYLLRSTQPPRLLRSQENQTKVRLLSHIRAVKQSVAMQRI